MIGRIRGDGPKGCQRSQNTLRSVQVQGSDFSGERSEVTTIDPCRKALGGILIVKSVYLAILACRMKLLRQDQSLLVDLSMDDQKQVMNRNLYLANLADFMTEPNSTAPNASTDSTALELLEYRESHFRTVLKTLSWRIVATTTTIVIAYFVFGDISKALAVGGIEFFAKMVIYYVHERVWQLVPRGTVRKILHH